MSPSLNKVSIYLSKCHKFICRLVFMNHFSTSRSRSTLSVISLLLFNKIKFCNRWSDMELCKAVFTVYLKHFNDLRFVNCYPCKCHDFVNQFVLTIQFYNIFCLTIKISLYYYCRTRFSEYVNSKKVGGLTTPQYPPRYGPDWQVPY